MYVGILIINLCYRDCNIIGLSNCGIGACAIDGKTCKDNVKDMVLSVLTGGLNILTKIFTKGNQPFNMIDTNLIKNGMNKLGSDHMNNVFRHVKQVLNSGKTHIHKEAYRYTSLWLHGYGHHIYIPFLLRQRFPAPGFHVRHIYRQS